jgi:hypothetical protein
MTKKNITISLEDFLYVVMGECEVVPLTKDVAEILSVHLKDNTRYYIQTTGMVDEILEYPKLWLNEHWQMSMIKWNKSKNRSEKDRLEWRLRTANVKLIANALKEMTGLDDEKRLNALAFSMLQKSSPNKLKQLGVKLLTKEEELK